MVVNSYIVRDIHRAIHKVSSFALDDRPDIIAYLLSVEELGSNPKVIKKMKLVRFIDSTPLKVGDILDELAHKSIKMKVTVSKVDTAEITDFLGIPTPAYSIGTDTFKKPFMVLDISNDNSNKPHIGQEIAIEIYPGDTDLEIYAADFPPRSYD